MARVMSDAEIRHRKKVQGVISRTTSTIGLGGLATLGAGAAIKRNPGLLRKVPRYRGMSDEAIRAKGAGLGEKAKTGGVISSGIGGLGGFNFASYTGAEAKKKQPVAKSLGIEAPVVGEEGIAKNWAVKEEIAKKEWSANASKFDSERSRMKRAQAYEVGSGVAAGGLAGGAVHQTYKAGKLVAANRKVSGRAKNLPNVAAKVAGRSAQATRHGKAALGLTAAAGAAGATGLAVRNRNRSRSWAAYGSR